ncbi:hypothetical protein [Candidatus Clostridium radicumherbarum]|uniref:Uncharacterized protein n=1 Tax=Candidatus Clostridium radicumherbarum TaxID=3381662 RepID=A0ABW8TSI9_9CLOT
MPNKKLLLTISAVLVLFTLIVFYNSSKPDKLKPINQSEVEIVNRVGGMPPDRWKVLFASKDYSTIVRIVALINSAHKANFNPNGYNSGKYPIDMEIKLKNNIVWRISQLCKVTTGHLENDEMEVHVTPYKDRVKLVIENGEKTSSYTLFSEQLADYIQRGAAQDMPPVIGFSITSNPVKPGQTVTISGDGCAEKYVEIYIADGNAYSNEKYLIARVPTSFGAWKWEETFIGRTIRTLDGKNLKLTKDSYFLGTFGWGVTLDLSESK